MTSKQQAAAKHLYFQTDLSKTQISEMLKVPRRTLHYWIREKNWDRVKQASAHMPALLAEKCYHLIARFSDQLLGEDRIMRPITHKEADTLHKLAITATKLKTRQTMNESLEMFGIFMESVNKKSPELAEQIMPFVEEYISSRAAINIEQFRPDNHNSMGLIPTEKEDIKETQLDLQDIMEWTTQDEQIIDLSQAHGGTLPPEEPKQADNQAEDELLGNGSLSFGESLSRPSSGSRGEVNNMHPSSGACPAPPAGSRGEVNTMQLAPEEIIEDLITEFEKLLQEFKTQEPLPNSMAA